MTESSGFSLYCRNCGKETSPMPFDAIGEYVFSYYRCPRCKVLNKFHIHQDVYYGRREAGIISLMVLPSMEVNNDNV
jgi:phage FluMu protein Com